MKLHPRLNPAELRGGDVTCGGSSFVPCAPAELRGRHFPIVPRHEPPAAEEFAAGDPSPSLQPVQEELEGSIYKIADTLWEFSVPDRTWHPGVCVQVDLQANLSFCCKGTDTRRARTDRFAMVLVEPSLQNGLGKATAFAFEAHRVSLAILRKIHHHGGWVGSLEAVYLLRLQNDLRRFENRPGRR